MQREMKQLTVTLLVVVLAGSASTQGQYPNCEDSTPGCSRDTSSISPLSYTTMRSDEYFGGIQPSNDGCTPLEGQKNVTCGVGTTLMDCNNGEQTNITYTNLSNFFVWNRTAMQQLSIVFRFDQPVNIRRISMFFWNAPNDRVTVPTLILYSSNDNSTTPSNKVTSNNNLAGNDRQRRRRNLNINESELFQFWRIVMTFTEGLYIFLNEVSFCGTMNTTTSITTNTPIPAATTTMSGSINITPTSTTIMFTTSPATSSSSSSSSGSTNIGAIVAPIIVIIVVAAVVVVLLIVFIWWRRRNKYHTYDDTTNLSKDAPYYSTVKHSSSVQNDDYYDNPKEMKPNSNGDKKPTMVYAVPNKGEKKEKRKSAELGKRLSIDFKYKPQRSPEMPVRSREQTLSLINPDYEHKMELDIYAAPDIPERTEASSIFDEIEDDPIYSEAINPSAIMSGRSHGSAILGDILCPYASIYADPMPLDKSEGPPIVSNKNIETLHQLGTGQFGEVLLANTVGLSNQYLGIGNSTNSSISIKVAVKTLKADPTDEVQKSFEKEIKFMSRLKDDNVIRLLGICATGTPFIMMEYMENGDLNQYLQQFEFTSETEKLPGPDEITLTALVYMSFQIASGMKYLSSRKFIHRDLATRNILVGVDYTVKIADFGMSQNLYSAYYYKVGGRIVLPIRWMAYECFFGKFSIKTDVWAYGITLWEIFTLCKFQPFYELSDQLMIEDAIKGKDRMTPAQPEICPNDVYTIMKSCFPHEPSERAGFDVLCDRLNNFYSSLL